MPDCDCDTSSQLLHFDHLHVEITDGQVTSCEFIDPSWGAPKAQPVDPTVREAALDYLARHWCSEDGSYVLSGAELAVHGYLSPSFGVAMTPNWSAFGKAVRFLRIRRKLKLFAYIVPRSDRERVFDQPLEDLLHDYLEARRRFQTPWEQHWLDLCLAVTTIRMVAACLRVVFVGRLVRRLAAMIPSLVRGWFFGIFGG